MPFRVVLGGAPSASASWNRLANAKEEASFCSAWLALQCSLIEGSTAGLLLLRRYDRAAPRQVAVWSGPERSGPAAPPTAALSKVAERALLERRAVSLVEHLEVADGRPGHLVAVPLGAGGEIIAVVAVRLASVLSPEDFERLSESLRWGGGWLESLSWARRADDSSADFASAQSCMDLLAIIGEQPRLLGATIALANDLACRLRCDRVSVGLQRRSGGIRLSAMSNSATFKNRSRVVDAIENAMEEAVDQRSTIAYPALPTLERAITMAHRALTEVVRAPGAAALTVALADSKDAMIGAITLERHNGEPFDDESLRLADVIARLVGPILGLHMRTNRLVGGRLFEGIGRGFKAVLGPRRPTVKLTAIGAVILLAALAFATYEHRIAAKAVLEPEVRRAGVAPFDGFIRSAPVRAGDSVKRGDLLASLDDRDLLLDQSKGRAERDKLLQRQRDALAKHDRSGLVILDSQIRQAEAQLALTEEKLERVRIVAPFDGIIVSGDLSQMLGSPVEKGKVLFEIATLDAYRLVVHVDERDIRYIAAGQKGTVTLAGSPWTPLPLVLSKITSVTVASDGRNTFRVEAQLTEPGPKLRPGMEGVAKVETGQQPLLWVWARPVIEWLRLAAWKYLT